MAETTRLVAQYEDVFLNGKRTELLDQNPTQVQVVSHDHATLICVMNQTSKPSTHKFTLPPTAGPGIEFYSEKSVEAGASVEIVLEPGEAAVYVLSK